MATAKRAGAKTSAKSAGAKKTVAKKAAPAKKAAAKKTAGSRGDAVALLTKDHRDVRRLFKAYEKLVKSEAGADERKELAEQICTMLTVHTTIEEEIFYPAMREALPDADLVDEATVEHASAKDLIAQIQGMEPDDDLYDAKVTVLGEYVNHHVEEEEGEMFPKAVRAKVDMVGLGTELKTRKEELMAPASMASPMALA